MHAAMEPARYARKACLPCRKSKRRCDKKLPSCDLCIRKEIRCGYPSRPEQNQLLSADSTPGSLSLSEDNSPWSTPSTDCDANAIYFIAPQIFQQAQLELPSRHIQIPAYVSSLTGDIFSIRRIATDFFTTIQRWLPIVSKSGFFGSLVNPSGRRLTELSLLALCMKLSCSSPSSENGSSTAETHLYRAAKQFHHEVQAAGILSLQVLQAEILIALYELGQAIYPAAYLTVGACARYGQALKIDKLSLNSTNARNGESEDVRSWHNIEEKRRVWWAVLIFDRFLSLSNPFRALSTEDPTFDTYLPVDDRAWDDCTAKPGDASRISTGFTLKMGSFARLSQATYLLSQSLQLISQVCSKDETGQDNQIVQVRRTLLALVHAADSEAQIRRLEFCAPSELSLSTILLLQEQAIGAGVNHEPSTPSYEILWPETRTAIDRLSLASVSYNDYCPNNPTASDNVPLVLMHVMYQVACLLLTLSRGRPDEDAQEKIELIEQLLQQISTRWRIASVYLNILKAREVITASEAIRLPQSAF